MHAKLVVVGGKANKSQVSFRVPGTIGRSREADLTVAHPMVSRRHCEIVESGGFLKIRDLGSLNGTFVRRKQVREAELQPNDEFTVGPLTFRVEYEPRQAATPPDLVAEEMLGTAEPVPRSLSESAVAVPPASSASPPTVHVSSPAIADEPAPAGVAPLDGLLPDFASWDAAKDSSASSERASSDSLSPADTGPLPAPTGDSSNETDFDLASEEEIAASDPVLSDLELLDLNAEVPPTSAAAAESAKPDEPDSEAERSTDDEDRDASFKPLE